jgi:hypothetical protein
MVLAHRIQRAALNDAKAPRNERSDQPQQITAYPFPSPTDLSFGTDHQTNLQEVERILI